MADEFPANLEYAINGLINTLVNKIITAEKDADAIQEFIQLTGISSANDVEIRNYATEKAEEIWGPYKELPVPSKFDGAIQALAQARGRLTNTGVTKLEDAENFSMGALVPEYMKDFEVNQSGWRGETIDAVRSYYLDRWGGMVFLQANTLALLEIVLRGYQEQMKRAQEDVVALVNRAEEVIASYSPDSLCGSGESKDVSFNIAIGVASVVSAAAGVASMGITSIVGAVVAAGLSVAKDKYQPDEGPKDPHINGDSVASIWQSILDRTEDLRKQFQNSEKELHDIVKGFHSGVIDGKVNIGTSGDAESVSIPAMELIRSAPLSSTSKVDRPLVGSENPDPAHSPQN